MNWINAPSHHLQHIPHVDQVIEPVIPLVRYKGNCSYFSLQSLDPLVCQCQDRPVTHKKITMLKLFTRYASVGAVNTLIHWVIFTALYTAGSQQSFSNFAAFCVAVTFSFLANAKWTFNSQATSGRYILYVLFMGVLAAAVGRCADDMNVNPIITLVSFSLISLVCGFLYSKFVIFREKK